MNSRQMSLNIRGGQLYVLLFLMDRARQAGRGGDTARVELINRLFLLFDNLFGGCRKWNSI